MSTPMRHGPSQGRTPSHYPGTGATPQASTPFSNSQAAAAFSPRGPRSSPQQFKKSPAASAASASLHAQQASQHVSFDKPVNFDSPSAAAALGAFGLADLNMDNINMGGLLGGPVRNDEEDRSKRMEAVIATLQEWDSARVSSTSLQRLATQLNLEGLMEDNMLLIAGHNALAIDIGIKNHIVHSAAMIFNESSPRLDKHVEKASAVLLRDLALAPGQSPLTKMLSPFRKNLARLASLDKLSVTPGLNCFDAIACVWESLERLHRWDVEKLREDPARSGQPEDKLRVEALCTRHGCPLMHTRRRVGLSLDYWKEKRFHKRVTVETEDVKTWAMLIECAPASSMVYTPVRVSDKWLGPDIEKSNLTDEEMISAMGPVLDWLEPPNTLLPPSEEPKREDGLESGADLSGPKSPDVIFVATFDPPVVVPHNVALTLYKTAANELQPITFDALMFPYPEGSNPDLSGSRQVAFTQMVPTLFNEKHGQKVPELKAHSNTLYFDRIIYGHSLTQVPFSHPKDLIAILPTLRQYAFLSLLLANSFKPRANKAKTTTEPVAGAPPRTQKNASAYDESAEFLSEANDSSSNNNSHDALGGGTDEMLKVDVLLWTHPMPRLNVVFPYGSGGGGGGGGRGTSTSTTANVDVEIHLSGKVHITSSNIFGPQQQQQQEQQQNADEAEAGAGTTVGSGKDGRILSADAWALKLEQTQDIGMWVEYLRHELE
ncbi:mediator of RNA polymerase II transcription subunit 1-domain-containing protein [Xylariaceae sp. FL0804]|nr:mediator of RNA polymerase II transcription subunit 1-domain-containing protein [Xylariaceae sp. FL0804]